MSTESDYEGEETFKNNGSMPWKSPNKPQFDSVN